MHARAKPMNSMRANHWLTHARTHTNIIRANKITREKKRKRKCSNNIPTILSSAHQMVMVACQFCVHSFNVFAMPASHRYNNEWKREKRLTKVNTHTCWHLSGHAHCTIRKINTQTCTHTYNTAPCVLQMHIYTRKHMLRMRLHRSASMYEWAIVWVWVWVCMCSCMRCHISMYLFQRTDVLTLYFVMNDCSKQVADVLAFVYRPA